MTWLGVGSVEGRVFSADPSARAPEGLARAWTAAFPATSCRPCARRGSTCGSGDVLVLATDGIAPAFADALDISGSTQAISDRILADHWKPPDDALVIAVRYLGRAAVSTGAAQFRAAYASALGDYLADPTEASLRVAYELGARRGEPSPERARPGRGPPRGTAVGARPRLGRRGGGARDAGGR